KGCTTILLTEDRMRGAKRTLLVAALSVVMLAPGRALVQEATEYGPPNGALVIAGGGRLDGTGIYEKFIELAGGPEAPIVIVPTAGGNRARDGSVRVYKEEDVI